MFLPKKSGSVSICCYKLAFTIFLFFAVSHSLFPQNRMIDSLKTWLKDHPKEDTNRVFTLHRLSYRLSEVDPSQSLLAANEISILAKKIGYKKGIALSLINFAILETGQGNLEKSQEYYIRGLKIAEEINYTRGMTVCLNNLGDNFRILKNYDKCLKYASKAMDLNVRIGEKRGQAINYELMGSVFLERKNYLLSLENFNKGLFLLQDSDDKYVLEQILTGIGKVYAAQKQYDKAFYYLEKSVDISQKNNDNLNRVLAYMEISKIYLIEKNTDNAVNYLKNALELANQIGEPTQKKEIFLALSKVYELKGLPSESLNYYKKYNSLSDSLFNEKNIGRISFLETQFQTQIKEQENQQLRKVQDSQTKEINQKNNFLIVFSIAFLLAFISAFLAFSVYRTKQKTNLELSQKNEELNALNEEVSASNEKLELLNQKLNEANLSKTKLFSIISHDLRSPVSNLFQFLQLQKENPELLSEESKQTHNEQIIKSGENLLETMEDILLWSKSQMDFFSPSVLNTNLKQLARDVIDLQEPLIRSRKIVISNDIPTGLHWETDVNFLKIILRNLINNAIKFSHEHGKIICFAEAKVDELVLSVSDNGKGMSASQIANIFEWNSVANISSGLGLKLTQEFTERLGGKLEVISEEDKGTTFRIRFFK